MQMSKRSSLVTAEILASREKLKLHHSIFINTQNEDLKHSLGATDVHKSHQSL